MGSFTQVLEQQILSHVFRNAAYTPPTTLYVALFTVAPTDVSGGTEVSTSGTGYARKAVTFNAPTAGPGGIGSMIVSTAAVLFDAATAAWNDIGSGEQVVAAAIMDAATAGNMLTWSFIVGNDFSTPDPQDVQIGDVLQFPAGGLRVRLD